MDQLLIDFQNFFSDTFEEKDYLHNEDKLLTLARQREERFWDNYNFSSIEELLYEVPYDSTYLDFIENLAKVFRKQLSKGSVSLEELAKLVSFRIEGVVDWNLRLHEASEVGDDIFPSKHFILGTNKRMGADMSEKAYTLTLLSCVAGRTSEIHMVSKSKKITKSGVYTGRQYNYLAFADLGTQLACLFLLKILVEHFYVKDEVFLSTGAAPKDVIYITSGRPNVDLLFPIYEKLHNCKITEMTSREYRKLSPNQADRPEHIDDYAIFDDLSKNFSTYLSNSAFMPEFFMRHYKNGFWFVPQSFFYNSEIRNYLLELFTKNSEKIGVAKNLRKKIHSCARACDTKKNIPDKMLMKMETSEFNRYFGFVEFDEDCDYDSLDVIGKEIIAFFNVMPHIEDITKKNAIRFRKLGKHKAIGLYYPSLGCLCVDLRNPYSFVHELGHLIDNCLDESGMLSLKDDFYEIKRLYRSYLKRSIAESDKSYSGKYNLDYYSEPTEIFARAFEIYVSKERRYKNSLIPDNFNSDVYPVSDKHLCSLIRGYFNKLELFVPLRGQDLLNTIQKVEGADNMNWQASSESAKEFIEPLSLSFNCYGTGGFEIPEDWVKRENKEFFTKVCFVALKYLSTEVNTWDDRKKMSAKVSFDLLMNKELSDHLDDTIRLKLDDRNMPTNDSFFASLFREFRCEHSTLMQSMASFFMRYLYKVDTPFKKAADLYFIKSEYINEKFHFPMI